MTDKTEISVSLGIDVLATMLVGDGNAQRLIEFMEHVTDAVEECYGRQYPDAEHRYEIFVSRIDEGLSKGARLLFTRVLHKK